MTHRTFVLSLVTIVILTLAFAFWPGRKPELAKHTNAPSTSSAVTEGAGSFKPSASASAMAKSFRHPFLATPSQPTPRVPSEARVFAVKVLAIVNGTPVQLRHLMPLRPDATEGEVTPEQYAFRLQRAIEMELTFQAARVQGVELTAAQQQRLEQVAAGHKADLEHYQQYGLTWSSITPEQLEFEKRLLEAKLLEQNLVAKKAAVFPSPDPEMQSRYEQVRRELLDQLQTSANITKAVPGL